MAQNKKHTPEQIASLLRQIEDAVANVKATPVSCRESGITEHIGPNADSGLAPPQSESRRLLTLNANVCCHRFFGDFPCANRHVRDKRLAWARHVDAMTEIGEGLAEKVSLRRPF